MNFLHCSQLQDVGLNGRSSSSMAYKAPEIFDGGFQAASEAGRNGWACDLPGFLKFACLEMGRGIIFSCFFKYNFGVHILCHASGNRLPPAARHSAYIFGRQKPCLE